MTSDAPALCRRPFVDFLALGAKRIIDGPGPFRRPDLFDQILQLVQAIEVGGVVSEIVDDPRDRDVGSWHMHFLGLEDAINAINLAEVAVQMQKYRCHWEQTPPIGSEILLWAHSTRTDSAPARPLFSILSWDD